MADQELIDYRVKALEQRMAHLEERLEHNYYDKREIQSEYLSQEANRRLIEQKRTMQINMWIVAGGSIVAFCALGAFIIQLVQVIGEHH